MEWKEIREELLKDPKVRAAYDQKNPYYQFIRQLIQRRKCLNITQADLAIRLGTTQSAIARLESGSRNVTVGTLSRMAKELGCTLKLELQNDEEDDKKSHKVMVGCTR